ncbi:MAG TPA: RDD family protein [Blastocatellia bacterium]|nr:RDD family protein [Blastocatellia bacterium]
MTSFPGEGVQPMSGAAIKSDFLCMGCMAEKGNAQVCPHCNWAEGTQPESPAHLPARFILNNQYLVGRVLGYGGFGITYLAWDLNLNMKVAIKEYFPSALATRHPPASQVTVFTGDSKDSFEYGLDRFIDEGRALARFNNSPGVVSVLNFFRANGTGYLVMSYLDGVTLGDYLDTQGGRLPYETAYKILVPVMDSLREVHAIGMLHRDISPDNIYITYSSQVKLLDFGAAKYAIGEHSQSLSVVLKPGYAPEEQYRSKGNQGPWTDVYAVGATFYKLITGQAPPEALDRLERDDIVPPSRMGIQIPYQGEAALLSALAVRAQNRFQDIAAFQTALGSVDPRVLPRPQKACSRCRRPNDVTATVCMACGTPFAGRDPGPGPTPLTQRASLGARFGAYVVDSIITSVFFVAFFLVFGFSFDAMRMQEDSIAPTAAILASLVSTVGWWGYAAMMEASSKGATIGKLMAGIKVTDAAGRKLSFGKALGRNGAKLISGAICGIGFFMALFDDKHQALHDTLSGTMVVHK